MLSQEVKPMKINLADMGNTKSPEELEEKKTKLQRQLAKVTAEIAAEEATEARLAAVLSAKRKIENLVIGSLTDEERLAVNGMYLFFHSTCVDIVRKIPSSTDKGLGEKFIATMEKAEARA